MGFLDSKERILDVVLTDKGRELLSQNLLSFEFFAFSDEGVDYSAALTASLKESGSVDDFIRRTPMMEAHQFKNHKEQSDMKSFLYTIPSRRRTLPQMVTNRDSNPSVTVKRNYFIDKLVLSGKRYGKKLEDSIAVVMQSQAPKQTTQLRKENYTLTQQVAITQARLIQGDNVTGQPIGKDKIMMNPRTVLDTSTGFVSPLTSQPPIEEASFQVVKVTDDLEVITGLDRAIINLTLESSEGLVADPSGYLIEVFESGSDGTLTKLFEEDIIDALSDDVFRKGFEGDLFVDVDATSQEIISEKERLERREIRRREEELNRLQKKLKKKIGG